MNDLLARIEDTSRKNADSLNELKGRAAAMPTMWQLLTLVLAVIGVVAAFATFTVNRVDRLETKIDILADRIPHKQ